MNKIISAALCLTMVLSGCQQNTGQPFLETVEYSNLLDASVQEELADIMADVGISEERRQVFFDHVNQFNSAVSPEGLTQGFKQAEILDARYDPYVMQDEWSAAHPDFLGYNCRITAYGLFGDYVEIPTDAETRIDMVLMDMVSLMAAPFIMENDALLEGYRQNQNKT